MDAANLTFRCNSLLYYYIATLLPTILYYLPCSSVLSSLILDGLLRTDERLKLCIDHTHAALVTPAAFNRQEEVDLDLNTRQPIWMTKANRFPCHRFVLRHCVKCVSLAIAPGIGDLPGNLTHRWINSGLWDNTNRQRKVYSKQQSQAMITCGVSMTSLTINHLFLRSDRKRC